MSSLTIAPAARQKLIPLLGVYGPSNSGKTFSALMFARGFVGPKGRIGIVDTENGRAHLFADLIPGGYEVITMDPPFSPSRYSEAFELLQANFDFGIFDSMSHEHDGEGGVLEMQEAELQRMAGDDYKRREACKMAAWIKPKTEHKKFVQKLLRSRIPLICCLRAQEKTHIERGEGQKSRVVTDDFTTPIYDPRFIFDLLANLEMEKRDGKPGCTVVRKWSHPQILELLPKPGEQISAQHGERLAAWCASGGKPVAPTVSKVEDPKKPLMERLYKLVSGSLGGRPTWPQVSEQLKAWKILQPTDLLSGLNANELESVIDRVEIQLNPQ